MGKGPTERQREVLSLVEGYWTDHGVAPSLSELAEKLGTTRTTLHGHLLALKKKGFLDHVEGKGRTWRPASISFPSDVARVPIVGQIAAGLPILARENIEGWLTVDQARGEEVLFALRVQGDSMTGAGILDGDFAIVKQQDIAENGDIVVALVNGEEATVKKLERKRGRVRLVPMNPAYKPIEIRDDSVQIQGKVIGVHRYME